MLHPCISLSDKQRAHLEYLLDNLRERIEAEDVQEVNLQQQRLTLELIKSMGQTFCYEILNMYFASVITICTIHCKALFPDFSLMMVEK